MQNIYDLDLSSLLGVPYSVRIHFNLVLFLTFVCFVFMVLLFFHFIPIVALGLEI